MLDMPTTQSSTRRVKTSEISHLKAYNKFREKNPKR